jgi:hypothetical protein
MEKLKMENLVRKKSISDRINELFMETRIWFVLKRIRRQVRWMWNNKLLTRPDWEEFLINPERVSHLLNLNIDYFNEQYLQEREKTEQFLYDYVSRVLTTYGLFLIDNAKGSMEDMQSIAHLATKKDSDASGYAYSMIINYLWRYYGESEVLISWCKKFLLSKACWENHFADLLLICICVFVKMGNIAEAEYILQKYIDLYGAGNVCRYFPVARFAFENGREGKGISEAARVCEYMETNRDDFRRLIEGKTVAIVGNGPSGLGKRKGEEIDGHDIVIRFNNYHLDEHEEDYGFKTDIWVRGSGGDDVIDRKDISKYKMIMWEADYEHFSICFNHLKIMARYMEQKAVMSNFDYGTHQRLRDTSKIMFPTSGLVAVWNVFEIMGGFNNVTLYGFSFLQDKADGFSSHYFGKRDIYDTIRRSAIHSFDKEAEFMKKIYGGKL